MTLLLPAWGPHFRTTARLPCQCLAATGCTDWQEVKVQLRPTFTLTTILKLYTRVIVISLEAGVHPGFWEGSSSSPSPYWQSKSSGSKAQSPRGLAKFLNLSAAKWQRGLAGHSNPSTPDLCPEKRQAWNSACREMGQPQLFCSPTLTLPPIHTLKALEISRRFLEPHFQTIHSPFKNPPFSTLSSSLPRFPTNRCEWTCACLEHTHIRAGEHERQGPGNVDDS